MNYEVEKVLSKEKPEKEELISLMKAYDYFQVYHCLFEMYGEKLSKEEYIEVRKRYTEIFDLRFVPLPEICEVIDEKWGITYVSC